MDSDHDDLLALAARLSAKALGEGADAGTPAGNSAEGVSPVSETGYTGNAMNKTPAATPSEGYPVAGRNRVQAGTEAGTEALSDPLVGVADLDRWPADCIASARRFGLPDALLYPLIGTRVRTPQGLGVLRQVIGGRAVVEFDGTDRLVRFRADEVHPLDMRTGGERR